ncbi:hypothetical protein PsYK624_065290 [Phanerochaete sordida]|uniref:Uncharacterized protein n=1 Tax=Phanerochaete sordida TaxID=48140 RepID=A0A9P3G8S7_9APHY|nr:hypothetical protein PsYK624_065290 [Phanerochaete sordida]
MHFSRYDDFPLDGPLVARVKNRYKLQHLALRNVGGPGDIRNLWKLLSMFKTIDTLQLTAMNMPLEPVEKCGSFPWHLQVRRLELHTSTTIGVCYWLMSLYWTKMGSKLEEIRVTGQNHIDLMAVSSTVEHCFRTLRQIDLGFSPAVYNPALVGLSNGVDSTHGALLSEDDTRAWCFKIIRVPWECIRFEICTKLRIFRVALPGRLLSGWLELLQHLPDRVEAIGVQYLHFTDPNEEQWRLSTVPRSRWTGLDKLPDRLFKLHTVEFDGFACLESSAGRKKYTLRSLLPSLNSMGMLKTLESAFEKSRANASKAGGGGM